MRAFAVNISQLSLLVEKVSAKLLQKIPDKLQQRYISGESYFNSIVSCDRALSQVRVYQWALS